MEKIREGICFAKEQYSEVLGNLENISEEIHRRRRNGNNLSLGKNEGANQSLRRSTNDGSLNAFDQKKLTEMIANIDLHEKQDLDIEVSYVS